jgi:hypothetical protein
MRVALPHFSHGGPASILDWSGAQFMPQTCGTRANLRLIQSMKVGRHLHVSDGVW